jgi:cellulose synthase/poly-beta-1,6-N-acetylglucosamine synthase-like glycosyltransferase
MSLLAIVLTIFGAVLVVLTLPLLLELLVLSCAALLPPRPARMGAGDFRLAVVVPAHNEQQLIGACVQSILGASTPSTVVYVVAHNCSDGTADAAQAAGAEVLVLNDASGGKGLALDYGFHHALSAEAEGVLVVDADSEVGPTLTKAVAGRFSAGAAALQARYEVQNAKATTRTRLAALAFLGMNVLRPRGRDRLGLSCGIFGNGFALSAATLRAVPYTANSLVEDLEYHLNLIRAGIRVEFVDDAGGLGRRHLAAGALGRRPHPDAPHVERAVVA